MGINVTHFEFLIPQRPVSVQTKKRRNLQAWMDFVKNEAAKTWTGTILTNPGIKVTLVYIADDSAPDADNIIKPIQDALIGLVYEDDSLVSDVDCHRRFMTDGIDLTFLPTILKRGAATGEECVYVKISDPDKLETYL